MKAFKSNNALASNAPLALNIEPNSKRKRPASNEKAVKIAKRLVTEATTERATCYCPITGLNVMHDLPPSIEVTLISMHPLAVNGIRLLETPSYILELNNEQLAGLVLALLSEANKVTISPKSNAYLVRAKLEAIATRNQLLDIIEWIANSLLTTQLYYPTLHLDHAKLTLEQLAEYMEWTYSIETYAFDGSKGTPVKAPKPLVVTSPEARIKRLNKQFNSTLALVIDAIDYCPDLTLIVAEEVGDKVLVNLKPLLQNKVDDPNTKLDGLLNRLLPIAELADDIQDMLNYRATAKSLLSNQADAIESMLEDYLPTTAPATPATNAEATTEVESKPEVESKVEVAEVVEAKTNPFLAKLAAAKAQTKKGAI